MDSSDTSVLRSYFIGENLCNAHNLVYERSLGANLADLCTMVLILNLFNEDLNSTKQFPPSADKQPVVGSSGLQTNPTTR